MSEIFASLDEGYEYADDEDYERLERIRYTNPKTGKRLLNKETEQEYKKLDQAFYAIKESEDDLM